MATEQVTFLFFFTILNWVTVKVQTLYLNSISFLKRPSNVVLNEKASKNYSLNQNKGGLKLSRDEVEIVMERMGLLCDKEVEKVEEEMGSDDISAMFEGEEPSLEEVRETFCVFDENYDGFIDPWELQRALLKLGFCEEVGLEECEGMIKVHDENRDGLIDINEFIKFMESSFC